MSGVSNKNTFDDNSFIDAIVERKKQIEYAISAMDASTHPQNFVGRSIYVNLMAENKSVFNKRSRKFLHFRDKRIKNLITLLADDIFWDEIYSPITLDYGIDFQNQDSEITNKYTNYLCAKSLISKLIYFLKGKNPYGKALFEGEMRFFEGEVEFSSRSIMLEKVADKLSFEISTFCNYCEAILQMCDSSKRLEKVELDDIKNSFKFLLSPLKESFKLITSLRKLWLKEDPFMDEDLILLWGGTKRAYYNIKNKPKRISDNEFGFAYDDSFEWLKLKNALGTDDDGFDYKERDSDISYPYNLDKLRPIFVSLNKHKVPLEGNTNIEKNEMNKKGNNIFESIEAIKKEYILNKLSVSEKQELKKKLLNLLNEIS